MKKTLLLVLAVLTIVLSGCDQLFSEVEIAFFNMKRIANVQMDITMVHDANKESTSFTVITDGYHQVTNNNEEIKYTYFNNEKDLYELVMIDDHYNSYKIDKVGNYDLDISVILELFLIAPEDFKKDDDGYYRPTVILYDFIDLEFKVIDGYITEMNFKFNIEDEIYNFFIAFSNINNSDFNFPLYHQYTDLEQAKYFLSLDNNIVTETELGFDITIDDILIQYISPNEYLTINYNDIIIYYDALTSTIKTSEDDLNSFSVEKYTEIEGNFYLNTINFEQLNSYYEAFLITSQTDDIEYKIIPKETIEPPSTIVETENNN